MSIAVNEQLTLFIANRRLGRPRSMNIRRTTRFDGDLEPKDYTVGGDHYQLVLKCSIFQIAAHSGCF